MLISEELSSFAVAKYEDVSTGPSDGGIVEPFDDPLFDFILTAGLDEADYSTIPEISRTCPFQSNSGVRREFEQTPDLPPSQWAKNAAMRYRAEYGYGPDVMATIRALFDLVANRVTRGYCHPAVGIMWIGSFGRFRNVGYRDNFQLVGDLWTRWTTEPESRRTAENQMLSFCQNWDTARLQNQQ